MPLIVEALLLRSIEKIKLQLLRLADVYNDENRFCMEMKQQNTITWINFRFNDHCNKISNNYPHNCSNL